MRQLLIFNAKLSFDVSITLQSVNNKHYNRRISLFGGFRKKGGLFAYILLAATGGERDILGVEGV